MYEIRSKDGKRAVMYDEDTKEYFVLSDGATYNGKKAVVFQSDNVYLVTEVWNCFGGSGGDYEPKRIS
jgi:hypothetical protein